MDFEVTSKVTAVTVYAQQARVTVNGNVGLPTGTHRLLVSDLPLALQTDSVRAGGQGTADVRVLGVDVRRRHYKETPAESVRALEERIEQLEDEFQAVMDEQAILEAQGRYLEGLRGASEQYARGLALGRTKVDEQARISRFFHEQDQELRKASRDLDKQKRVLNRELNKARRELEQIKSARPAERNEAIVEVEVITEGDFEVEIIYNVNQAGWTPLYDVRLVDSRNGSALDVEGIAQIVQSSGQDWVDVVLKVSTARINLNRRIPELRPWYIDVYQPPMPRSAQAQVKRAAAPQAMMADSASAAEAKPSRGMVRATASAEEGGAIVTYAVAGGGNIPSDGSPHKTGLFRSQLPAHVDFVAVPKHTDAVFRRIKATNDGPTPLLAGTVQLFVGRRYIGASRIKYVPVGDEVELLLGVEERLTIEREMTRRDVDKARLRDKRQTQYGYEITVKNLLPELAKVEIHDQLPVARHEEIKVKLLDCSPQPAERSELNLLEWHLTLEGKAEVKVHYEYQVEHPRSMKITGLID